MFGLVAFLECGNQRLTLFLGFVLEVFVEVFAGSVQFLLLFLECFDLDLDLGSQFWSFRLWRTSSFEGVVNILVSGLYGLESILVVFLEGVDRFAHFLFGCSFFLEAVKLGLHFLGQGILLSFDVFELGFDLCRSFRFLRAGRALEFTSLLRLSTTGIQLLSGIFLGKLSLLDGFEDFGFEFAGIKFFFVR